MGIVPAARSGLDIVKTGEGALKNGVSGGEFHQSRTMATVLGVLLLAGATIGALSLLLPQPEIDAADTASAADKARIVNFPRFMVCSLLQ